MIIVAFVFIHNSLNTGQTSGITFDLLGNSLIWLSILVTCAISLFLFVLMRLNDHLFTDNIINNLRHKNYEFHSIKKKFKKKLAEIAKATRFLAKFLKFYKSEEEQKIENHLDKKMKEVADNYKKQKSSRIINNKVFLHPINIANPKINKIVMQEDNITLK